MEGNQILRFEQIDRKPVLMERADGEYHVGKINFGGLDKTRIEAFCVEVIRRKFRFL